MSLVNPDLDVYSQCLPNGSDLYGDGRERSPIKRIPLFNCAWLLYQNPLIQLFPQDSAYQLQPSLAAPLVEAILCDRRDRTGETNQMPKLLPREPSDVKEYHGVRGLPVVTCVTAGSAVDW